MTHTVGYPILWSEELKTPDVWSSETFEWDVVKLNAQVVCEPEVHVQPFRRWLRNSIKELEESDFVGTLCRWFGPTNILLCITFLFFYDILIYPHDPHLESCEICWYPS